MSYCVYIDPKFMDQNRWLKSFSRRHHEVESLDTAVAANGFVHITGRMTSGETLELLLPSLAISGIVRLGSKGSDGPQKIGFISADAEDKS